MTEMRRGLAAVACAAAAIVAGSAGGAAAADSCAIQPPPSPYFSVSITGVTCGKAKPVVKKWDGNADCHSSLDAARATCDVKGYACTSRITNTTGAAYEKVTCKKGDKKIKFSYGTG